MTDAPKRKPIRLTEYDYSTPGAYFVTICTQGRRRILSDITAGDGVLDPPCVHLTEYGAAVEQTLLEMDRHYAHVTLEKYVIMPNHIHLLIRITGEGTSRTPSPTDPLVGAGVPDRPLPANAVLPMLISTLKRFSNRKCGVQLWQRSYHEHVIRNERDYEEIWTYIDGNPAKWTLGRYYET